LTYLDAILLGLVQGLTEFLPVSSSGHLVITRHLLDVPTGGIVFEVVVHLGTALAVCVFMRRKILEVLAGLLRLVRAIARRSGVARVIDSDPGARLGLLVAVSAVPTGLIGLFLNDLAARLFESTLVVGIGLLVTGVLLQVSQRFTGGGKDVRDVSWFDALVAGVAQGCAIVPGLSRSGTTVSASLLLGLTRETAAELSFLMSIPVILGAAAVELLDYAADPVVSVTWAHLLLGAAVAAVSGYVAISVFMNQIKKGRLAVFSWYCFAVGAIVILMWGL
jgi:undecaprenyl-diphosphatase